MRRLGPLPSIRGPLGVKICRSTCSGSVTTPGSAAYQSRFLTTVAEGRTTRHSFQPARNQFLHSRSYSSGSLPSHVRVKLPALSPTMEMGTVVAWHKKEGDQIVEGDLLCEIETDKATMGFETPEEGFLAKVLIDAGTKDVPIGKLLCIIVPSKDDVKAFADFKADSVFDSKPTEESLQSTPSAATPPAAPASSDIHQGFANPNLMGPAVRLLLHHYGLKEADVKRSGPKQNILKEDVLKIVSSRNLKPAPVPAASHPKTTSPPAPLQAVAKQRGEKFVDIPLTNIRSVIAKRLLQSKQTIPHQYLSTDIPSNKLDTLRKTLKAQGVAVSVNDFLVKACAMSLRAVPEVNVQWKDDSAMSISTVDVSVAVATPSGLITPIVFSADQLSVGTISQKVRELAKRARENKLQLNEFQGGTFTISNLGMFGSVTNFTAIINPPQAAILAVGGARQEIDADLNSVNKFTVTLCFDARAVEAEAARRFLAHLRNLLAEPAGLVAETSSEPFQFDFAALL